MEYNTIEDLPDAMAVIAGLEAENKHLNGLLSRAEEQVTYHRGIARQSEDILRETGLAAWFSGKPEDVAEQIEEIKSRYTKGQHMEIFEAVIKENPMVAAAWDRFMVSLRLCGYDGTRQLGEDND